MGMADVPRRKFGFPEQGFSRGKHGVDNSLYRRNHFVYKTQGK